MPVELVPAAKRLSQGDFLAGAPCIWLESLYPMVKVSENRWELRQTFLGTHLATTKHKANASEVRVVGAVLSHDCELDKVTTTATVLVALVRTFDSLDEAAQANIRENRQLRALYVPPSELLSAELWSAPPRGSDDQREPPESYIDFRRVTTITRKAAGDLTQVASMGEEGKLLLHAHLFRFFSRRVLPPEWTDWEVEDGP